MLAEGLLHRVQLAVTFAPSADSASMVQAFTAFPSTWTTQAPHCDVSQPTCVPVSLRFSRMNWTSSVRGSTSAVTDLPFTVMDTVAIFGFPPDLAATDVET
jgi:hypothetical protein